MHPTLLALLLFVPIALPTAFGAWRVFLRCRINGRLYFEVIARVLRNHPTRIEKLFEATGDQQVVNAYVRALYRASQTPLSSDVDAEQLSELVSMERTLAQRYVVISTRLATLGLIAPIVTWFGPAPTNALAWVVSIALFAAAALSLRAGLRALVTIDSAVEQLAPVLLESATHGVHS